MPTYRVTDPTTGQSLKLTGDSPPTEQELEEIFGSMGQQQQAPAPAPTQQTAPEPPPTAQPTPTAGQYGPWQGIAEPALAMGTGLASSAAGGLTAIAGMGKDLYDYAKGSPITFDQSLQKASGRIQGIQQAGTYQPRSDLGKGVTEVVNWPIEKATEGWGMIGEGVGNALGNGDAGKALGEVGFQSAAVLAGRPWRAGAAAPITEAGLMNELGQVVNKGFEKGIKPKGVAKTRQEILRERDLQLEAVNSIVKGKEYLKFKDEFGEVIEGKVPKNLDEMSQAVQQRKLQTIEEANKMNLAAGEAGVTVPLNNVMTKLQEIIDNPVLQDNAPHAVNYARKKLKQFEERGEYTPMEAQESMAIFNQSEAIAKANPSRATISNAQVDSLIANNLRADLNAAVESATGPGYAALRKEFGALKSIEEPVNSRLKKHRQQNENSTLNLYNVFSANDMLQGVGQMASGNVAAGALSAGKGMGLGWIADKIKKGKDPNRAVERMFTRADDITGKLQKLISEKEAAAVVASIDSQMPPANKPGIGDITNQLSEKFQEVPEVVNNFERMFQIAQSPIGKKLLLERLGREERNSKLVQELMAVPEAPPVNYPLVPVKNVSVYHIPKTNALGQP